jgi:hypothetical protein
VPTYEIRVVAQVEPGSHPDVEWLRRVTGGEVRVEGVEVVTVVVRATAPNAEALSSGVVGALRGVTRCGIYTVRRRGLLRPGGRTNGSWTGQDPDDDGLSGVREPRRPLPSAGSASVALEPPAA